MSTIQIRSIVIEMNMFFKFIRHPDDTFWKISFGPNRSNTFLKTDLRQEQEIYVLGEIYTLDCFLYCGIYNIHCTIRDVRGEDLGGL